MTNFEKLRQLTEALIMTPTSQRTADVEQSNPEMRPAKMKGLLKTIKVGVSDMFFRANSEFPAHAHDEYEVFVLYMGHLVVTTDEGKREYKAPTTIVLHPGEKHQFTIKEDTLMIAVSIPAIKTWPEGEQTQSGDVPYVRSQ